MEGMPLRAAENMSASEDEMITATAQKAEVDESEVKQRLEDTLQEWKDEGRIKSDEPEDEIRLHALRVVKNDLLNMTGGGGFGGGEAEELPILTLGFQRKEADYFVTDNDAILASGIINPADAPAGYAVFILDSGHGVDLEHTADAFMPLNTVRGYASIRQVGSRDGEPALKKGGQPTYLVNSTDESTFEIVDPDEVDSDDPLSQLPSERDAKREMINKNFITEEDHVTLQSYAEHESVKNDNGYELAFGVDVKRIRGEVVDGMIFDSGDGVMTVTDDTVFSEDDIPQDLISDQMRTPGLQVSCAGDLVYGKNSVLDIYGFIQQRDDGQYRMQALGVIPIVDFEYVGPEGTGSSSSTDDAASEDTI
jgi:hypothetical protein